MEGGRERGREGWKEGGRDGWKEGGRERCHNMPDPVLMECAFCLQCEVKEVDSHWEGTLSLGVTSLSPRHACLVDKAQELKKRSYILCTEGGVTRFYVGGKVCVCVCVCVCVHVYTVNICLSVFVLNIDIALAFVAYKNSKHYNFIQLCLY